MSHRKHHLRFLSTKRRTRNRKALTARQSTFEIMENRELMAADMNFGDGFTRVNDVIRVQGTNAADEITVDWYKGRKDKVRITVENANGRVAKSFRPANFKHISIYGNNGNDRIENKTSLYTYIDGGRHDDTILGGSGRDTLQGNKGDDYIDGRGGHDKLSGHKGNDIILGGTGEDTLYGQWGKDKLYGGDGNDTLKGGDGNDHLNGGRHHDKIFGELGNDFLYGSSGDDYLDGGNGKDILKGKIGKDTLRGGADSDKLYGGDHDDDLNGGTGSDKMYGEGGHDVLYGSSGNDAMYGGNGNDVLNGAGSNDYLNGGSGADRLLGGDGNDRLFGSTGGDELFGGTGDDQLAGAAGNDLIDGGSGVDEVSYYGAPSGVKVDLRSGYGRTKTNPTKWGVDTIKNTENLIGSPYDDDLRGDDSANRIEAREGNDFLYGRAGNDTLLGESDNDVLKGQDGRDTLLGGAGNDTLEGGEHNDVLRGGADNDVLRGEHGSDKVFGEAGTDWLMAGRWDTVDGGEGVDLINGTSEVFIEFQAVMESLPAGDLQAIRSEFLRLAHQQSPQFGLQDFSLPVDWEPVEDLAGDGVEAAKKVGGDISEATKEVGGDVSEATREWIGGRATADDFQKQMTSVFESLGRSFGSTVIDHWDDNQQIFGRLFNSLSTAASPADVAGALWTFVRAKATYGPTHSIDLVLDLGSDLVVGALFGRKLHQGEIDFAHEIFGGEIDVSHVRIVPLALSERGMVGGNTIYLDGNPFDSHDNEAVFAHELTHIYQDQHRSIPGTVEATREFFTNISPEVLVGRNVYQVDASQDLSWHQLGPEQQATVVENYKHYKLCEKFRDGIVGNNMTKQDKVDYLEKVFQEAGLFEWRR